MGRKKAAISTALGITCSLTALPCHAQPLHSPNKSVQYHTGPLMGDAASDDLSIGSLNGGYVQLKRALTKHDIQALQKATTRHGMASLAVYAGKGGSNAGKYSRLAGLMPAEPGRWHKDYLDRMVTDIRFPSQTYELAFRQTTSGWKLDYFLPPYGPAQMAALARARTPLSARLGHASGDKAPILATTPQTAYQSLWHALWDCDAVRVQALSTKEGFDFINGYVGDLEYPSSRLLAASMLHKPMVWRLLNANAAEAWIRFNSGVPELGIKEEWRKLAFIRVRGAWKFSGMMILM